MSATRRSAQRGRSAKNGPPRIAFQGERGAFSEEAARLLLGDSIDVVPCVRFDEVFQRLTKGEVDGAVIPIENTLHGSVHENYDHLLQFELPIVGETKLRISHQLMAPRGVRFRDIRRVYSHPVALNQCLTFFADNPHIERMSYYDTAGSAKMVMEQQLPDAAAIASAVAAEIYQARIVKKSIEDDRQNFTRFFLLRRPDSDQPKPLLVSKAGEKTSLVFSTRNVSGALFRALSAFALRDLSLTKIESRPLRGKPWEYLFYLDFLGAASDERSQRALAHLSETADFVRVLGSYPRGY